MTEGRFETIHNLRPRNWDHRRHWTNWHHLYDCDRDHLDRESCPFHDFRAGGQFQYQYGIGDGQYTPAICDNALNKRVAGDRMDFAKGKHDGIGGTLPISRDNEAGRPTLTSQLPRKTALFTKRNPLLRGLFSQYPHMPQGSVQQKDAVNNVKNHLDNKLPSLRAGSLKAGGPVNFIGAPVHYYPDLYNDKRDRGRIFRLKTGPVKHDDPRWMPNGQTVKRKQKVYGPFLAGCAPAKRIGADERFTWIPDPHRTLGIENRSHPFRTWHTRTKHSMPVLPTWTTGLSTADPRKGKCLDLTQTNVPSLSTYKAVCLTPTIGSEAALRQCMSQSHKLQSTSKKKPTKQP